MTKKVKKKRNHKEDVVGDAERYVLKPLKEVDFDLEKQAIQQILDATMKLQTYIALREQRR